MANIPIRHVLPYGVTKPRVFQVYLDEQIKDLSGTMITLEVQDRNGSTVVVTGTVQWLDAALSKWRYLPDLQLTPALAPYRVRAKITDGAGFIAKVPEGDDPDTWDVVTP